jgi:ribosomal subunit interface protein
MQFVFRRNHLADTTQAEALIEAKYPSLRKYWSDDATVLCEVEFQKVTSHKSGNVYQVEVNLTVDGALYRAEAVLDSFEKAIDEVRAELDKELRRAKKRGETLERKGGRTVKALLQKK